MRPPWRRLQHHFATPEITYTMCKYFALAIRTEKTHHGVRHAQLLEQQLATNRGVLAEEVSNKGPHSTRVRRRSEWEQKERVVEAYSDNVSPQLCAVRLPSHGKLHDDDWVIVDILPRFLSSSVQPHSSSRTSSGSTVFRVQASSHFCFCRTKSAESSSFLDLPSFLRREKMPGIFGDVINDQKFGRSIRFQAVKKRWIV